MGHETTRHLNGHALRLAGIELRRFSDGATMALTPSGRMYRIEAEPTTVYQVLQACDGERPASDIIAQSPDPAGFSEVFETLLNDGCLRRANPAPNERDWLRFDCESPDPSQPLSTHIILLGDTRLITLALDARLTERFASAAVATIATLGEAVADHAGHPVVVIALREAFDHQFLTDLNDFCEAHQIRWTQLHIEQGHGWIGPSVLPGSTPDYRDLLGRRLAAAEFAETFYTHVSPTVQGQPYVPPSPELMWMLAFLFADVERWTAGVTAQTVGNEVEADPVLMSLSLHPVLPLPHRKLDGKSPINFVNQGVGLLYDDRTGLITHLQKLDHHPSIPASLATVQSHVADMRRLYIWANNTVCSGSTFGNLAASRGAALGEGLERYCGNWVQTTLVTRASYRQLRERGEHAVDPERLILYSDNQYRMPGLPFVRFTRDLEVHWVRGWSLTANKLAWVPASLVYVNWYTGAYEDDPPTNFLYYPGLAAGPNLEAAVASGIEEVIERHATMVWWTNRQPLPAMKLTPELAALWEGIPHEMGQRAWVIHLDNEFNVPVMAGVVENVNERLFNIGFDAHHDPIHAALKAWTEALTLQDGSRDLLDPDGLFRQAVAQGQLIGDDIKPWRSDRAYLDDYREDFKDINDLMCQQQVFLDPRAREYVRPWVDVPATRSFDELPSLPDRSIDSFRKPLEDQGYEIFYVDVTTPDVDYTGFKVVRVVVPGMIPNFPAGFPFLGHAKIQNVAVQLGWRDKPLAEEELNYFPMPHA